jgi:hypothetical protein
VTINLKIEIVKIFSFEFSLSSKDILFKKEKASEESNTPKSTPDSKQ